MKVAFIGLGIMGSRMASRLAKHGIDISVYNRNHKKALELEVHGAKAMASISECVADADVVFTMLSTPEVVDDVAFSEEGFVKAMQQGSIWVDCSTVDPAFSKRMYNESQKHGIIFVDAPVAGTKQPAELGELVFLVGSEQERLAKVQPLFEVMGKKVNYLGEVGNGSSMKMLINLMLAQSMVAFSEAVHLGVGMGLDEQLVYQVLSNSPVTAPFLGVIKPKLEQKETSTNFPLKWMHKDLHLVSKVAYETGISMPSLSSAKEIFSQAKAAGHGDEDFSTIYHFTMK